MNHFIEIETCIVSERLGTVSAFVFIDHIFVDDVIEFSPPFVFDIYFKERTMSCSVINDSWVIHPARNENSVASILEQQLECMHRDFQMKDFERYPNLVKSRLRAEYAAHGVSI